MSKSVPPPTAKQTRRVAQLVRKCLPLPIAGVLAGLSPGTVESWMLRGTRGRKGDEPFVAFKAAIDRADEEVTTKALDTVIRAADRGDVRAAAWLAQFRADVPKL